MKGRQQGRWGTFGEGVADVLVTISVCVCDGSKGEVVKKETSGRPVCLPQCLSHATNSSKSAVAAAQQPQTSSTSPLTSP